MSLISTTSSFEALGKIFERVEDDAELKNVLFRVHETLMHGLYESRDVFDRLPPVTTTA